MNPSRILSGPPWPYYSSKPWNCNKETDFLSLFFALPWSEHTDEISGGSGLCWMLHKRRPLSDQVRKTALSLDLLIITMDFEWGAGVVGAKESSSAAVNLDRFLEILISTVDGSIMHNTMTLVPVGTSDHHENILNIYE